MESKVVVVSIIVRDEEAAAAVNDLLHEYRQYIVGHSLPPEKCVYHQCGDGRAGRGGQRALRQAWHAARCDGKDANGKGINTGARIWLVPNDGSSPGCLRDDFPGRPGGLPFFSWKAHF